MNKKIASTIVALLVFAVGAMQSYMETPEKSPSLPTSAALTDNFTVTFLDVGQGDSALFQLGNEAILIDAGTAGASDHILETLHNAGVAHLIAAVATHPHADHIGAMDDVLYEFPTHMLLMPNRTANTKTFDRMLDAAEQTGTDVRITFAGEGITLDEGVTFTCLSPYEDQEVDNTNDSSLVYMVQAGDTRILMMGDAEKPIEANLLESGVDLSCDIVKLGHHGSSTSNTYEFLQATGAQTAIISCGEVNDYGHPHVETLDTLEKLGMDIIYTYNGDYTVTIPAN